MSIEGENIDFHKISESEPENEDGDKEDEEIENISRPNGRYVFVLV